VNSSHSRKRSVRNTFNHRSKNYHRNVIFFFFWLFRMQNVWTVSKSRLGAVFWRPTGLCRWVNWAKEDTTLARFSR
jgi:hypothetical protein